MTLKLISTSETFKLAIFGDDALDMTREEYQEYLKNCDNSQLKLLEGKTPTFFVIRKVLPSRLAKKIENEQVSFVGGNPQPNLGNLMIETVRASICGVENPPDVAEDQKISFKAESDGGCPDQLMQALIAMRAHHDIFAAISNVVASSTGADKKK